MSLFKKIIPKKRHFNPIPGQMENPSVTPNLLDKGSVGSINVSEFNQMQFDQVYLYKFALMMAIHALQDLGDKRDFQVIWDFFVESAGAYIVSVNDPEYKGKPIMPEEGKKTC